MVREGEKCLGCLMSICLKETVACCSVTAVVCFLLFCFGSIWVVPCRPAESD